MSTYKMTGPDGCDYAVPSKRPLPPPPRPVPPPPAPHPCPPPPPPYPYPPYDWEEYPYWEPIEPVPVPPIPGRKPCPHPPFPPYPIPVPEKIDECSKKLAKLTRQTKTLVQMIKDFEQKNKPAILTIGKNSYQFGTENIIDFNGEPAKGQYSKIISGDPIDELLPADYEVDSTNTRVSLKNPTDLLQSELARIRKEITLIADAINEEIQEPDGGETNIPGSDP